MNTSKHRNRFLPFPPALDKKIAICYKSIEGMSAYYILAWKHLDKHVVYAIKGNG
jgi:hypothetical protein